MRSGGLYLDDGSAGGPHFGDLDVRGQFSSSSASSADYAHNLLFYAAGVYPSNNSNRWHGFPLRYLNYNRFSIVFSKIQVK